LLVRGDGGTWYGWLGYLGSGPAGVLDDLRRAAMATGELVTLGDPCGGRNGFRTSHEAARRTAALRGSLHSAGICLSAHELRLEALLMESPDSARRFLAEELGGLAADSDRAGRTRDTLLAWLSSGSQAQAAIELGVHENTVRQRIRYAAEELGTSPSERRTELLVALRLCAALGPSTG
jgi:DNA-binding PucR family transcriptional regulator